MSDEQPFLLATLPPSREQIRLALSTIVVLFVTFCVTIPFTYFPLPRIDAFIPSFQTAILINDLVTSALLFAQFTVLRQWAVLLLASGYLFTAMIVIPHALTFPGLFSESGLLGAGLESTVWLYIFWHLASPLAVIAYMLVRDVESGPSLSQRSPIAVGCVSAVVVIAAVCGLTWFTTAGEWLLPHVFVDRVRMDTHLSALFSSLIMSLDVAALMLLWFRRRTVLDLWLMVVCCTWLFEATLSALLIESRYSLGWYAGRIYGAISTTFVLLVLLSETTILYAHLAKSVSKQRDEGDARQIALDAMTASIAHEVNQPLGAIVANSEAASRFLEDTPLNINEMRAALEAITSDSARAGEVIAGLRAMFKKDFYGRAWLDVNDLVQEVLTMLAIEIRLQRISVATELRTGTPKLFADQRQLRQLFLNLISNALEAMRSVTDRPRNLRVTSDFVRNFSDVLITIEDSGVGIDTNDKDRIFEAFFTTKTSGMGMGLNICQSVVGAHGGSLQALANNPYGAIFRIVLPIDSGRAG